MEIGCQELGIATDDPRGLTVTGGLPYFGGAGNNYVMHSIVTMMQKLRAKPGQVRPLHRQWLVCDQAFRRHLFDDAEGRPWQREDPKSYQKDIDAMAHPEVIEQPTGSGDRRNLHRRHRPQGQALRHRRRPRRRQNRRFLANTPDDDATLDCMMHEEMLGRAGDVTPVRPTCSGSPDGTHLHGPARTGGGGVRRVDGPRSRRAWAFTG